MNQTILIRRYLDCKEKNCLRGSCSFKSQNAWRYHKGRPFKQHFCDAVASEISESIPLYIIPVPSH